MVPGGASVPARDNVAEEFLKYMKTEQPQLSKRWGMIFDEVPDQYAASYEFWGYAATFLVDHYTSTQGANKGDFLDVGTAHGYWGGWFNKTRLRLSNAGPEIKVRACLRVRPVLCSARTHVLVCLCSRTHVLVCPCSRSQTFFHNALKDDGSDEREWYRGIKSKMERLIVQRKINKGEPMDQSATEIYLEQIKELSAAWARADGPEAASRKFATKTLWRSAGRSSEPAALALGNTHWKALYSCAATESPEPKPSKMKHVLFPAGTDRCDPPPPHTHTIPARVKLREARPLDASLNNACTL